MMKTRRSPAILITTLLFCLTAAAATAQTGRLNVLRTESYGGTECYRILNDQGMTGFFSLTTSEMVSSWFQFVSFKTEKVMNSDAYRVQTRSGYWTFLDPHTSQLLTRPVDYLSPGRYQADERIYYKAEIDGKEYLLSVTDGSLIHADRVTGTITPVPRDTVPAVIPSDKTNNPAETAE